MPATLPEAQWGSVGIVRINNIPSHVSFGDAHAEAIISGAYPLAQAIEDERRRLGFASASGSRARAQCSTTANHGPHWTGC